MTENKSKDKGLLIVYTGDGKGKTTAALGMAIRAVGYDWKVAIVQFIKGSWKYGEMDGLKRLAPNVELSIMGEGFVGILDDDKPIEQHREAARKAFDLALEKMESGKYELVILDEMNVAVTLGLISNDDLKGLVARKPEKLHLVITGRGARPWLIEQADLVTEMKEIKHPFKKGILAQRGVDF
ncbi:MAG: cob(I)yrinic acid a,c-diamide adenosyltransferase [candidate division Zixibacteria bacterium HGW-Zixibacteria-1]|nr:MAG: cob(I)yrinic acid a,c-diamide adenosyltransferase [candidate division Zixibacteria bacterium HGW-Zixibacteria-1]